MKKSHLLSALLLGCLLASCGETSSPLSSSTAPTVCPHEYGQTYQKDSDGHWQECSHCHETTQKEAHSFGDAIVVTPATCLESGTSKKVCSVCDYEKSITVDPLGHRFSNPTVTAPTSSTEGTYSADCDREGCQVHIEKKILKLPTISLSGSLLNWSEVDGAEGYKIVIGGEAQDVGSLTSYELSDSEIEASSVGVYAYTSDDEYIEYADVTASVALSLGATNIQEGFNYDFEKGADIRLDRIAAWNNYPYGNWSDVDGNGVGGHFYIHQEEDGNMCAKVPATTWYPGNTYIKKDLGGCFEPGTYQVNFDVKVSEKAYDSHTAAGAYGHLKGFVWSGDEFYDMTLASGSSFYHGGIDVHEKCSTSEYRTFSAKWTITKTVAYSTVNIIYWPEDYIGEDNYVLIDNFTVNVCEPTLKIVLDDTDVDSIEGGDFEMFDPSEMNHNIWYCDNTVLPENNALGSAIIKEGENHALKIHGHAAENAFNLAGNPTELGKGGIYELSLKVKKGTNVVDPILGFTMWAWNGGSEATHLTGDHLLSTSDIGSDEYVTITKRFITSSLNGCTNVNIYFWCGMGNDGETDDPEKFMVFDDVVIKPVIAE